MGPPGWLVGPAVALGTLHLVLPLLALGMPALVVVPAVAMGVGAAAASLVDSRRRLNTIIVVMTTALVFSLTVIDLQLQPPPPGASYGGPSVSPPPGALRGGSMPSSR